MQLAGQLAAVAAVLALAVAAAWVLRRANGATLGLRKRNGRIQALERIALTPQASLHLVRIGGRALVVAVHPAGCSVLDQFEWRDPPAAEAP